MHRRNACLAAALAADVLSGCGPGATVSSAAPPTVVCGTTLSRSAAGPVVVDATRDHAVVTELTVGEVLYVRVSDDCAHGARVTWDPRKAATLVKEARAKDGLPAAVVLRPATPTAAFTLSAERDGTVVAHLPVRLASG
jgi:hypothetical protein